ncbi:hypothetical protein ACQY0O_007403 [Thecaphora frezii]
MAPPLAFRFGKRGTVYSFTFTLPESLRCSRYKSANIVPEEGAQGSSPTQAEAGTKQGPEDVPGKVNSDAAKVVIDDSDSARQSRVNMNGDTDNAPTTAVDRSTMGTSVFAIKQREFTQLMNELRACGASLDVDVPRIAIIGNQSCGKSSAIEAISGITLPKANGTCTRCPMEVRSSFAEESWSCQVKLRFERTTQGDPLPSIKEQDFGPAIRDRTLVEDRLKRAQLVILNPSTDPLVYLKPDLDLNLQSELSFSENLVCIKVKGPNEPNLSFVDLPSIISSGAKDEEKGNIDLIKDLARATTRGSNCMILLTLTMADESTHPMIRSGDERRLTRRRSRTTSTDGIDNQWAAMLSREVEKNGDRTTSVLTKPDREESRVFSESQSIQLLAGRKSPLKHGY